MPRKYDFSLHKVCAPLQGVPPVPKLLSGKGKAKLIGSRGDQGRFWDFPKGGVWGYSFPHQSEPTTEGLQPPQPLSKLAPGGH